VLGYYLGVAGCVLIYPPPKSSLTMISLSNFISFAIAQFTSEILVNANGISLEVPPIQDLTSLMLNNADSYYMDMMPEVLFPDRGNDFGTIFPSSIINLENWCYWINSRYTLIFITQVSYITYWFAEKSGFGEISGIAEIRKSSLFLCQR
jgi:hypothetical protein